MSASEGFTPTVDTQRLLERADSQLAIYARDLKHVVDSERKKSKELADANARLRILDRLKTEFLTFISHELRTPLNAMSMIDLFDPQGDQAEQVEMIDVIRHGYERLHKFILKGLEYFSWLAESRSDTSATADMAAVVRQAADGLPGLRAAGVRFRIEPCIEPCLLRGNETHLAEVVTILLENALKFSPQEEFITAELTRTPEKVTLAVTDRGVGLTPEMLRELFHPFTIADVQHHSVGTGLSLALASVIVKAYGGRIRAESGGVGKGARFVLDFPALTLPDTATTGCKDFQQSESGNG